MLVFIIRHGIAAPHEEFTIDDERPLTEKGVRRMREITIALSRLGVAFDEIWTSPLVRARQTADILGRLTGFFGPVRRVDQLSPGGQHEVLLSKLADAGIESVALVGHEPDLGRLCSRLLTTETESVVVLKKGAIACLMWDEGDPAGRGILQWLMQPAQLRRIRS